MVVSIVLEIKEPVANELILSQRIILFQNFQGQLSFAAAVPLQGGSLI